MKRSEALVPLSHDHHHALYVAKLLRDAAKPDGDAGSARAAFTEFWEREGMRHFRIEEEVLLPGSGLAGPSDDPQVARMLDEHLEIRRLVEALPAAGPQELAELGQALSVHVRFEERELFPRIEESLPPDQLDLLASRIAAAEGR